MIIIINYRYQSLPYKLAVAFYEIRWQFLLSILALEMMYCMTARTAGQL
jgi:hypothetical protein